MLNAVILRDRVIIFESVDVRLVYATVEVHLATSLIPYFFLIFFIIFQFGGCVVSWRNVSFFPFSVFRFSNLASVIFRAYFCLVSRSTFVLLVLLEMLLFTWKIWAYVGFSLLNGVLGNSSLSVRLLFWWCPIWVSVSTYQLLQSFGVGILFVAASFDLIVFCISL